jgi:hypothetical protein
VLGPTVEVHWRHINLKVLALRAQQSRFSFVPCWREDGGFNKPR